MSFGSKTVFLRSSFHTFVAGRILCSNGKFIEKNPLGRENKQETTVVWSSAMSIKSVKSSAAVVSIFFPHVFVF